MKTIYTKILLFSAICLLTKIGISQTNNFSECGIIKQKPITSLEGHKKKILEYIKSNPTVVHKSLSSLEERTIAFSSRQYGDNGEVQVLDSTFIHYTLPNTGIVFDLEEDDEIFGIDTAYSYTYYLGILSKTSRYTLQYNSAGYNIMQKEDTLSGNTWVNIYTTTITRNSNNKILTQISNPPSYKIERSYDTNNNLTSELNSNWDGAQYVINNSQALTYYPSNKILTETNMYYDTGVLNYQKRDSLIYNSSNLPVTIFTNETYFFGGTVSSNLKKTTNTYVGNNLAVSLLQDFNTTSSSYVDAYKFTYLYSGNNEIEELGQTWSVFDNLWLNYNKKSKTYFNNKLESEVNSYWNPGQLTWVNSSKQDYTYSPLNNTKSSIYYNFDNGTWIPNYSQYFYYQLYEPNAIVKNTINQLTVYPNPASNFVYINASEMDGTVYLTIFDVVGKNVLSMQINNSQSLFSLPINSLTRGSYFMSIENNNTKKFANFIKE